MAQIYKESEEQYQERMAFEASHNFKVGDLVLYSAQGLASIPVRLKHTYADFIGKVIETKTRPEGGPMIRVEFGGVRINIWHPNEELIRADLSVCKKVELIR